MSATIRLALASDESELIELLRMKTAEEDIARFDEEKMRLLLRQMIPRYWGMVAVVPGKGEHIDATTGLILGQWYFSSDWHLERLWDFVRPEARRSTIAKDLIVFAKQYAENLGLPLIMEQVTNEATARKEELVARQVPRAGGLFRYKPSSAAAA